MFVLPFEKPIVDLVEKVKALRALAAADQRFEPELLRLEEKTSRLAREIFADLSPIQKVQISRHASRPYTLDDIKRLFTGWIELKGDRRFADDAAIVAGLASYHGRSVVVVGHQKGRGTKENLKRNFGMYVARARVPIIATIIGEGGSGGALALGVANNVLILEFGCYSVITPEGCAAILWNDASRADEAARQLKITGPELLHLGVVDTVVDEPTGGAHQDHDKAAKLVDAALWPPLTALDRLFPDDLVEHRYHRFRTLGSYRA